ncbi:MAG: SWIM zinc finger family protein [Burkholderia gladioli]
MPQFASLADVLTLVEIRSLADPTTFARGKSYFHDGVVSSLEERDGEVRATVRGTHRYRVRLTAEHGSLAYRCNCPVGDSGIFCKHAVAVALSWLENTGVEVFRADEPAPTKPRKKRKTYADIVRDYVATLSKEALQTYLLDAAERDVALRDRLLFAARASDGADAQTLKAVVRQMTRTSGLVDWQMAGEYADGLLSLADMLRQRLSAPNGQAKQVVELSELAIAGAEHSLEQIDDSNGNVMPAILELAAVHLDACKQTAPEPVTLAERLFRFQTESPWETFYDVLPAYAEPLGKNGLLRYRELVHHAWEALPELTPEVGARRSHDSRRMRLEHAMSSLAEFEGNIDELIHIHSKDLSSPYRYLLIAELCEKHDRADEGLAWAERGRVASGKNVDMRLLDFCIDAYVRRREFEKADACAWQRFAHHPSASTFPALLNVAKSTGKLDETRNRALAHLQALIAREEAAKSKRPAWQRSTRTELVMIFLAARQHEDAWAAFTGGPVATQLWSDMAATRGRTHPYDAIALYHRLLPIAVDSGTHTARYDEAFDVVKAIDMLRARLGEHSEFANELEEIRMTYRAKRNFIKLLAQLS